MSTPDYPLDRLRGHKLLTVEDAKKLPALRAQDGKGMDAIVHVKFFTPSSSWTWYVTEGEPDGEVMVPSWTLFGYVIGLEKEWGYFDLAELATVKGPYGLPVERDCYFTPGPLHEVLRREGHA